MVIFHYDVSVRSEFGSLHFMSFQAGKAAISLSR